MGVETCDKQKLFIRFPEKIKDEFVIRDLHVNIHQVYLPRQKSRRWCIIEFVNKDKLEEALPVLRKVKINNKSIKIGPYKKTQKKNKAVLGQSTEHLLKFLKKKE